MKGREERRKTRPSKRLIRNLPAPLGKNLLSGTDATLS
jgi:hypothetical protein